MSSHVCVHALKTYITFGDEDDHLYAIAASGVLTGSRGPASAVGTLD